MNESPGEHAPSTCADETSFSGHLVLRPVEAGDRERLVGLLNQPGMRRRDFLPGVDEVHPVDWSTRRRSFSATLDDRLIGAVELIRDEDDPSTWELSLALDCPSGVGGRCVSAALYYAFEHLAARDVWFWVPRDTVAIKRIAARFGFTRSHGLAHPIGPAADVYEVTRGRWTDHHHEAEAHYLVEPMELRGARERWRGVASGFQAASRA
ncbi:MAG: GNAT family N-acetyltransferase [Myxococcales bacterium]|nr:GNAT family N-acetyltransferase [Myxococcales bacterium]MCB9549041.1 GNAT family N-acetyltransferase [Myxococcales bacterium]